MNELLKEFQVFGPLGFQYCVVHIVDDSSVAWFIMDSDAGSFIRVQYVPSNYRVMTQKDVEGAVQ